MFEVECQKCNGTGHTVCGTCNGTKRHGKCLKCNGDRMIQSDTGDTMMECPDCEGTGKTICPDCLGEGETVCSACDGTGEIENEVQ